MWKVIVLSTTFLFLASGCGFNVFTQVRREDQPIPDELYELVKKQSDLINQELAKSGDEWAGSYYASDHHPTLFKWSRKNGFIVEASLHSTWPSWVNHGKVTVEGSILTIHPEMPKENQFAHTMPNRFQMIRWDHQHLLIPINELKNFAYAVHSRAYSQIVEYFVKGEDKQEGRPRGLPQLPSEYSRILRMPAINAKVTSVAGDENFSTVTLGTGTRNGIIEGMLLYHDTKRGHQFTLRITKANETTSEAEVWGTATTGDAKEENVQVKPGWVFTSRIPKGFIEPG